MEQEGSEIKLFDGYELLYKQMQGRSSNLPLAIYKCNHEIVKRCNRWRRSMRKKHQNFRIIAEHIFASKDNLLTIVLCYTT